MNSGVNVERRAAKGVNKPGSERSVGFQLAERENKAGQEKGVWASCKERRQEGRDSDDMNGLVMMMMLSDGRDGSLLFG